MDECYSGNHVNQGYETYFLERTLILNVKNKEASLTQHNDETSCCWLPMSRRAGVLRLEGLSM